MKRISESIKIQAYDDPAVSDSAGNRTLFAMLLVMPCVLALAYGANDSASLVLIALLTAVFSLVWFVRAIRRRFLNCAFRYCICRLSA